MQPQYFQTMEKWLLLGLFCCLYLDVNGQYRYALRHRPQYDYEDNESESLPSYKVDHKPIPYEFAYNVKDDKGQSHWHKEESDEFNHKKGSYGYVDEFGVYRTVNYVADHDGFRVKIKTNEPGTANYNPAHVYMHAEPPPQHLYSVYQHQYHSRHQPQYDDDDAQEYHPTPRERYGNPYSHLYASNRYNEEE